jgi:hypothetical protein
MTSAEFVKMNLKEHLSQNLVPHVADGLWSLYDNARELCERTNQVDQTLRTFQNLLTQIPGWSEETLNAEVDRIVDSSKCEYLDDLLMGVFLAYIRAFASLQYRGESPAINLNFERPSVSKFIHEFYKHGARSAWKSAYLFKTHGTTAEQQARNRRDIEHLLDKCMTDVINAFIPWKEISRAYFQAPSQAETEPEVPKVAPKIDDKNVKFTNEESDDEEEEEDDDADSQAEDKRQIQLGDELTGLDLGIEGEEESDGEVDLTKLNSSDTLILKL